MQTDHLLVGGERASKKKMFSYVRHACLLLIVATGVPAFAQYPKLGVAREISTASLDEMQDVFALGNSRQRAELFVRLGMDRSAAQTLADASSPSQPGVIRPLQGGGRARLAILFVPGGPSASCFLYLLEQRASKPKSTWRVIDQQGLDSWDGTVSLEIAPLREAKVDDIILHHVNESHGTEFVAGETQVYSVFSGKLVRTLATEDFRKEELLGEDQKARSEESQSTFQRLPGSVWEETHTLSVNGELTAAKRRYWRWSETKRAFTAGPFSAVHAHQD